MRQLFSTEDAALTLNYLGFVYRLLVADGHTPDRLLKGTGLTEENIFDADFRCAFKQHKVLCLNAMVVTGDPHLGLRSATMFNPVNIGLPASTAMSSDNLSIALEILEKYLSINFPIVTFSTYTEGERLILRWQTTIFVGEIEYFVLGAAVMVFEKLFRLMLKEERVCEYAEFAAPQPPGPEEIGEFLDFPVYFDAPFTRLVLPIRYLDAPIADADPIIYQRSLRLCEKQLAESFFLEGVDSQVRGLIVKRDYHNVPIDQASAELGLSERNLRRQLSQSGTSYKKIVDDVRESRARELLAVAGLPITDVAHELGFSDSSNFARTFKRWTGVSPHELREASTPSQK